MNMSRPAFTFCFLLTSAGIAARASTNRLVYTTSWIGNSCSGGSNWVQQDIKAMAVTPDGSVYANVPWDEGGREVGVCKDGRIVGMAGHSHGWGYHGGTAIALNGKYVFIGESVENEGGHLNNTNSWPPKGYDWFGVSRRRRSDLRRGAPFAGGKGGDGDTLKGCFLVVNQVPNKTDANIQGLWANDTRVWVSDTFHNRVRVYDAEAMTPVASWGMPRPGQMAMDAAHTLWIIQKAGDGQAAHIVRFTTRGRRLPQSISFPKGVVPTAVCFDPRGRLLVTDDGPNQQVRIYRDLESKPVPEGTFGEKGGIYAGIPGAFGPLKFNRPMAVGCDAKGNLYVASNGSSGGGGTVLESYTPKGRLNWRLFGLEFVDRADVDPQNEQDVYTKEEHFRMDYSQPPGRQWTYAGYTIDRFWYPEDPRLHIWSAGAWVRRIKGRLFLFVNDMYSEALQVYRFDRRGHGEIAIPCGLFAKGHLKKDDANWPPNQPEKGEWIWRDANGNGAFDAGEYSSDGGRDAPPLWGWWVDGQGNVWQATESSGIREFPCGGLDANGSPIYRFTSMRTAPMPAPFTRLERIYYFPANDTMYLAGYTARHPHDHGMWKVLGRVICRYDNWSGGGRKPRWEVVPNYKADGSWEGKPASMTIAGDYLFVAYVEHGRIKVYILMYEWRPRWREPTKSSAAWRNGGP